MAEAQIINLAVEKLSRDATNFDATRDRQNREIPKRKQSLTRNLVAHGSMVRRARHTSPANPHDWPGWFKTTAFQEWLETARGIRDVFAPEHRSYRNVKGRCAAGRNTLDPAFNSFRDFLAWVLPNLGRRPSAQHTLDRTNGADPVYGPGRVRWADKAQQAENRQTTKRLPAPGGLGSTTVRAVANATGQRADTIRARIRRGWSYDEAASGRRVGARNSPEAAPNLWPAQIDPGKHARAYAVFIRTLPPVFQRVATRELFLWALYVPRAARAAHSSNPGAAKWLAEHGEFARYMEERLAGNASSMIREWMECNAGSHEHRCGCILARHGIALAHHELGWLPKQPAPPVLPVEPPPVSRYSPYPDDGDYDPGDHDPGDE